MRRGCRGLGLNPGPWAPCSPEFAPLMHASIAGGAEGAARGHEKGQKAHQAAGRAHQQPPGRQEVGLDSWGRHPTEDTSLSRVHGAKAGVLGWEEAAALVCLAALSVLALCMFYLTPCGQRPLPPAIFHELTPPSTPSLLTSSTGTHSFLQQQAATQCCERLGLRCVLGFSLVGCPLLPCTAMHSCCLLRNATLLNVGWQQSRSTAT